MVSVSDFEPDPASQVRIYGAGSGHVSFDLEFRGLSKLRVDVSF